MGLHRSLALGASAFLVVHIATAIIESYVNIDAISAIVPFTSGYESAWTPNSATSPSGSAPRGPWRGPRDPDSCGILRRRNGPLAQLAELRTFNP